MFTPRTTPLEYGEQPWRWDVPSVFQCTWWVYFRCLNALGSFPVWWDRNTQTGSYPNAKQWLENFRDPWEVKGFDYTPKAGDVAVFDGEYGHVQFMETDTMYSEYSSGDPDSFRNGKFVKKDNLLGFLHYPYNPVETVERNPSVNQIQTTDDTLRIRTKPSLEGEVVGHVQIGYYNVLSQKDNEGYTWYEIAKDRWCANITTVYLPSDEDDIIKQIEKYFNDMKAQVNTLKNENTDMKKSFKEVYDISKKWVEK